MVIHTTLNFTTMTINQIKKQIATAEKNIAKFKADVARYMTRRDNAIAKANKKGIAITADDFHVDNADDQYPDVNINDDKRDVYTNNFAVVYPITNNWSMALQNNYMVRRESRRYIYARIIWCAENSVLVTPHTRYIVTSKNI